MRRLGPLLGLSVAMALVAALAPAFAASPMDPVVSPATGASDPTPPPSLPGSAPSPPGAQAPAAPPAPGTPLPEPGMDLGRALQPDLGAGLWFAVGIGTAALALAAASMLGTRFVNSQNVLENDARRAIFEYIKNNPGCHLRETAAALQLSTTNVLWHLRKLEESNLVNGRKLEGYKVFYPVEGGVEAKRMGLALAVLRNSNAVKVLGIIARNPGVHQREIARVMAVNHGTVRWHLKKLSIVQLILEVRRGAISQYYVSALGLQALERAEGRAKAPGQPPQVEVAPPPMAEA